MPNDFFLELDRAMVSLGPIRPNKNCPYSCAFCYVQDGFIPYKVSNIDEIIKFLKVNREKYNIIYISGDTDSFAPIAKDRTRTKEGLSLLLKISEEIDCDLLFTTRAVFESKELEIIKESVNNLKKKNKLLFACQSITRYSKQYEYLEPQPICEPDLRIENLKNLKELGAVTVLAMRPFLPVIPLSDYVMILEKCKEFSDIVLGEKFYFKLDGKICKRVFLNGVSEDLKKNLKKEKMNFNDNTDWWDVYTGEEIEKVISEKCKDYGIIFSMHSSDAIKEYKEK